MVIQELMTLGSLTAAINKLPPMPTKIGAMNLFTPKPISTTTILIDELDGRLSLVPSTPRGGPATKKASGKRRTRSFRATHLSLGRLVLAEDSQGVREFGSEDQAEGVANVVNSRLQELKNDILVTREYQRIGAIKGQVLDEDGTTVLADMYSEFGVTQKTVAMALASNTNPRAKLMEAKRASEKAAGGVILSGTKVLASPEFMDALTGNEAVKKVYEGWQASQERNGGDVRGGFIFGGCEFIEYDASVGERRFIGAGDAYLFPTMPGLFIETFSPADYIETVNTLGKEFYAKASVIDKDKGWDIEAQSNPLAMCTIPGACIKLTVG
jgi:hypothetical protein